MPAEVNGNHVVAQFSRARVTTYASNEYCVCGNIIVTPYFVFMSGHGNEDTDFAPVVSIVIPREDVRVITDHSVEACETHDKMDAEAKATMNPQEANMDLDAKENKKD